MGQPPGIDAGALLRAVETAAPSAGVGVLARRLAAALSAREVSLLVLNIFGSSLVRVARERHAGPAADTPDERPLAGTSAGRALGDQRIVVEALGGASLVHVPVTERGEALGVLEVVLPAEPTAATLEHLRSAAHALAFVLIAERRFTDAYETAARHGEISLPAEIQRRLLPSAYTCETAQFTLAGWLVPADTAGGDTFDYAVGEDALQMSVTDAMGHGMEAAQLATLALAALRNARRLGGDLVDQARTANEALAEHAHSDQFVTGQLIRVDLRDGRTELVNAGHVLPVRVRDGQARTVVVSSDPPFGVVPGTVYRVQPVELRPGDRLVVLTDGMQDRTAMGADLVALLESVADRHPRDVVQVLTSAVIAATGGSLPDDATVLVLDWHGPDARRGPSAGTPRGPEPG